MSFDLRAAGRIVRAKIIRHTWTNTQQRWTTSFAVGGLVLGGIAVPPFGIAVFGTAFAGWWIAVLFVTLFCGLVGNRFGIGREKAALERADTRRK
ncbi:hypothetical protein [Ferirhizobium litorale]|uniref:Uncharacterized protein n=1 Tax=Ferirhizobium litorale TaxID=2927786 RepID=A0AAE3TZX9_9HYPH|nr:hypothetical protein [Fererhizobium litorale]MDI7920711.1 hypothetical protein [Fererhizobium litorale]